MSYRYSTSNTDNNHQELMDLVRDIPGATAHSTHGVGQGFGDFVVGFGGYNLIVEAKSEGGKLRTSQEEFAKTWQGSWMATDDIEPIIKWINFVGQLPCNPIKKNWL